MVKPRPLFLSDISDIQKFSRWISTDLQIKDFSVKLSGSMLKLQFDTVENFQKVQKALKAKEAEFFYFQLPEEKPFKIVIKGIHTSTSLEEIQTEIEAKGFKVLRTNRAQKQVLTPVQGQPNTFNKHLEPIPIVFVDVEKQDNCKELFNIIGLCHQVVKIESPKKSPWQPQCRRCQRYGHVQSRCSMPFRCVKCLGQHKTAECDKKPQLPNASCALGITRPTTKAAPKPRKSPQQQTSREVQYPKTMIIPSLNPRNHPP
ncbi:unnamed protein product [Bemisia tabaci]|uniref:Pre-C2HC domain-containing protein n=1 Tax=Bemisia tabaci TaxID=7038 RepID=A0A9P0F7V4_BEMTA|nr:unnamed protein product [Bemisia tabaci]